jgi:acyl-coenzyme A synthetase/AMP-(fatty) acid ligase
VVAFLGAKAAGAAVTTINSLYTAEEILAQLRELEALLIAHPGVADAGVVGRPDPEVGERPAAFVVRRGEVSADQLIAYVAERVAPYEKVREVVFVDEIPRSATGKILRRVLADSSLPRG